MFSINWEALFVPSGSLAEIALRGSAMYLTLFLLLRLILKRQTGGLAITDVLVTVLIADAAQNGMAGEYRSITEGVLLVAVIIAWSYALDWVEFRSTRWRRLIEPAPLLLYEKGGFLRRNMRRELITEEEVLSAIRQRGFTSLADVERVVMEPDGALSVAGKR